MSWWKTLGRRLLRYVVLLLAVGPFAGVVLVWSWMSIHGLSPDRAEIFDRGNLMMGILMLVGGIGIALEIMLTPLLRNGGSSSG
jgi:hypothetical protein